VTAVSPRVAREGRRFFKFTVVGSIGFVVDAGTLAILTIWIGLSDVYAQMLSFTAALTSNFIWNRFWTYPDSRSKPIRHQAVQFAIVNLIRTLIFIFAKPPLTRAAGAYAGSLQARLALDEVVVGRYATLALAVIVVLFWNFGVNRIWTYSDVS